MVTIANFETSDYEQVLDLIIEFQDYIVETDTQKHCKLFDSRDDAKKYLDQMLKDILEREGVIYLAKQDSEVIGLIQGIINRNKDDALYALTHNPGAHGWIGELYIKPSHRGTGISRRLVDKLAAYFKTNGCISIRLMVMADNKQARQAYDHLNFIERDLELSKDL